MIHVYTFYYMFCTVICRYVLEGGCVKLEFVIYYQFVYYYYWYVYLLLNFKQQYDYDVWMLVLIMRVCQQQQIWCYHNDYYYDMQDMLYTFIINTNYQIYWYSTNISVG